MRAWLLGLATCFPLVAAARAQFHSEEGENFHNTTFLTVDEQARQYLLEAELAAGAGDVDKAATALRRLLLADIDSLLPQSERMFRDAREVAALRLLELGPAAVERYRKLTDEPASIALKAALNPPASDLLLQLAVAYPLSSARSVALEALGDLAAEAGRLSSAAYYYRALLRDPNLPSDRIAIVRAKALLAGDSEADAVASHVTDLTEVRIAGNRESLAQIAARAHADPAGEPKFAALLNGPERTGRVRRLPTKLTPVASGQLRLPTRDPNDDMRWLEEQLIPSPALPPSPIIVRDRVFFAGRDALWFFELKSGRPLHDPIRYDTECLRGDHEYVQAGSPSITAGERALFLTLNAERNEAEQRGFLGAYDVETGARSWTLAFDDSSAVPEVLRGLALAGPPLLLDDRLYVSAARLKGGDTESYVLSFEASSGRLQYMRFICSASYVARYGERFSGARPRLVLGSPLSAHDGVLYTSTNLGVIAAVAAESGRILWAFKYNRLNPQDPSQYLHQNFYDAGPWPPTPVMIGYNRVQASPADSRYLYVLDLFPDARGHVVLGDPIERDVPDRLIGLEQDGLILQATVSRTFRLMTTDLLGTPQHVAPAFRPSEVLAGYPLVSGMTMLYPTTRDIYWVSRRDGLAIQQASGLPWRAPEVQPGTLAALDDYVVCQSPTGYHIFRGE